METIVKNHDMDDATRAFAIELAGDALSKFKEEKDIAGYIKKEFDRRYGATWHCVVGRSFGSYVTHDPGCFIYFYHGSMAFLIFKNS